MLEDSSKPVSLAAEVLLRDFLLPNGLGPITFSYRAKIPEDQLRRVLDGDEEMSIDMAIKTSIYFRTSVTFWLDLMGKGRKKESSQSIYI